VITPADGVNLNYEHPLPPKDNYEHPLPPKDKVFSALVILASLLAIMFALTVWLIGFDKVGAAVFAALPARWRFWDKHWQFLEAAGLILAVALLNWLFRALGEATIRPMSQALSNEIEANLKVTTFGRTNEDLNSILLAKFQVVNRRAQHHFMMVTKLAAYTFMQIIMVLAMSGPAAITLFLLSRKGWNSDDNLAELILFAVTTTAAALYAAVPRIFRVNENFRANALAYLNILQLGDQIRTYAYTSEAPGAESLLTFLTRIDQSLAAYRTVAFNFDLSQAPAISTLLSDLVSAGKKRPESEAPAETEAARRKDESEPTEKEDASKAKGNA
jgi:hypothetical protein